MELAISCIESAEGVGHWSPGLALRIGKRGWAVWRGVLGEAFAILWIHGPAGQEVERILWVYYTCHSAYMTMSKVLMSASDYGIKVMTAWIGNVLLTIQRRNGDSDQYSEHNTPHLSYVAQFVGSECALNDAVADISCIPVQLSLIHI